MTTQAPDRIWSGIDISKTLAGALAAVCAAVAGSYLGVAGTLIGAAVASIIGSVGTEVYARSINRGTRKLQTIAPSFIKAPAAVGTPPVEAATEEDSPSHTVPVEKPESAEKPEGAEKPQVTVRWSRIALIAGALFVLAIGTLTMVELFAGRSVASMVGHDSSGSTTVSSVTDGGDRQNDQPTPLPSSTPSGTESTAPETSPTEAPTSTTPTEAPATEPTTEAPATEAPATEAPQQTPPPATQQIPQELNKGPATG